MNKTKIGIGAIIIIIAGYIFAAPYITVYQMKKAGENKNGESLSEYVEFPTLRQNLKDQINAMFMKEMGKEVKDSPFSALGAVFGGMMAEKMVDVYVTPAGITELMSGEKLSSEPEVGSSDSEPPSEPFANASMSYESFNKFSVTIKDKKSSGEVKFILRRRGIGWKLTEIIGKT